MSLQKFLPAAALGLISLCNTAAAHAQTVFVAKHAKDATVRVYVTTYKGEADVVVFKTPFIKNAEGNKGQWYFTKFSGQADKRICYTDTKLNADVVVFFTPEIKDAGWKNKKKRFLMN